MSLMQPIKIDQSILEQFDLQPEAPKVQTNGMKLAEILDYMHNLIN